jgi:hypothetical protein
MSLSALNRKVTAIKAWTPLTQENERLRRYEGKPKATPQLCIMTVIKHQQSLYTVA